MKLHLCVAPCAAVLLSLSIARAQVPQPTGDPPPVPPDGTQPKDPPVDPPKDPGAVTPPPVDPQPIAKAPDPPKLPAPTKDPLPTGPAAPADATAPGWRKRLHLDVGPVRLVPIVLIDAQATPYAGADSLSQAGDIAEQGGFRLRRARFGFGGDVARKAEFRISAELGSDNGGSVRVHDAWAGYTEKEFLQIYAGAQDVPFSRSALVGSGDTALIERPFAVRAMAPQHQVGAVVASHLADGALNLYFGGFNGLQRSDQFYSGFEGNFAALGNRFDGLCYAPRVTTEPLGALDTIQDLDHSPFRFGAGLGYFFSDGGARDIHSVGGDFLVHVSGLHVLGEVIWSRSDPESVPTQPTLQVEPVTSIGFVFEAGYMIVKRTFGLSGRFELINPNTASEDQADNWMLTAGASYHLLDDAIKVQAEYTHREEIFESSLKNDSLTLQLQLQL